MCVDVNELEVAGCCSSHHPRQSFGKSMGGDQPMLPMYNTDKSDASLDMPGRMQMALKNENEYVRNKVCEREECHRG